MKKGILITGSSQGIGLGIARQYAQNDFHVFLNYLKNDEKAEHAKKELEKLGGTVTLHRADVRSKKQVIDMFDEIKGSGVSLDTVVLNAVDEIPKPIDKVSLEEWHQVLLTKLDGAFLVSKYSIPLLQNSDNPALVYITSSDGWRPNGEYIAYQVGTAGLIAMFIANAIYLSKKYKIRVNAVAPGPVKTGLWEKAGQSEEMWNDFAKNNPVGRVATVEDVAKAVWYVAEDPNKFINATTINVDGGSQFL